MRAFHYIADPVRQSNSDFMLVQYDGADVYTVWMSEEYVDYQPDELDFEIRYV